MIGAEAAEYSSDSGALPVAPVRGRAGRSGTAPGRCTAGRDVASLELTKLCAPGVVVDLSDQAEDFGIYTPADIERRVTVKEGDVLIINTGYHVYGWDSPTADERRYMLRHPGPSLDFIQWVRD